MASNASLYQLLSQREGSAPHFDPVVKSIMDAHLEYIKSSDGSRIITIDNRFKGKYFGDFYAILDDAQIDQKYQRIVMLANGLTNPIDYVGQMETVFIPNIRTMDQILGVYNTGRNTYVTKPGQ